MKAASSRLDKIENRISDSEKRIETLEVKVEALKTSKPPSICPEEITGEIEDRSRRVNNIIIHNLPESTSRDIQTRISHDKNQLENLLQSINFATNINRMKLNRIGRAGKDKPRPMKVILNNTKKVNSCIELFNAEKETNLSLSALGIFVSVLVSGHSFLFGGVYILPQSAGSVYLNFYDSAEKAVCVMLRSALSLSVISIYLIPTATLCTLVASNQLAQLPVPSAKKYSFEFTLRPS